MSWWSWLLSILAWLAADPAAVELEHARAAGAVAVAYAAAATEAPQPEPEPAPPECACGGTCKNGVWRPDGRIVQPCPCPASCKCKAGKCSTGACPPG